MRDSGEGWWVIVGDEQTKKQLQRQEGVQGRGIN